MDQGKIKVTLSGIDSTIFLEATVTTETDTCTVTIRGSHTNIVSIVHNGATVFKKTEDHAAEPGEEPTPLIHTYTLAQLAEYAQTVPVEEIAFIQSAYDVNLALYQEGIDSPRTTFAPCLLRANGGKPVSEDVIATAQLLAAGAVEARVLGLDQPAMSITGSGAHGILATLPLYAAQQVWGLSEECLWRATALSYLVCMYIKEYSGRLSAFCGCAIAAGTGAGLYDDMASTGERLVSWHREFTPNPQHRELYQEMMSKWQTVYADQLGLVDSGLTTSMWQAPGLERRQRVASSPSP